MILKNILAVLLFIWVFLAAVLVIVNAYRGLVCIFKNLKDFCKTWEDWAYSILLIDVALMVLVGILIFLFN